jgi:hypothetical protein
MDDGTAAAAVVPAAGPASTAPDPEVLPVHSSRNLMQSVGGFLLGSFPPTRGALAKPRESKLSMRRACKPFTSARTMLPIIVICVELPESRRVRCRAAAGKNARGAWL